MGNLDNTINNDWRFRWANSEAEQHDKNARMSTTIEERTKEEGLAEQCREAAKRRAKEIKSGSYRP